MTITSHAISSNYLVADDVTAYTVTLVVDHTSGEGAIASMRTMLHDYTTPWSETGARGYLAWGATDADIYYFEGVPDSWTLAGDATGGGRWGYRTADYGGTTYVTPVSCSTSASGTQRTVTFTFTVKPAWAPASNQKLWGSAHDTSDPVQVLDWAQSDASYRVRLNYDAIPDRCIAAKDNLADGILDSQQQSIDFPMINAADIVWCDDFNTYCEFNRLAVDIWPGYPPTPDNMCGAGDVPSGQWFRDDTYHWGRMIAAGSASVVNEPTGGWWGRFWDDSYEGWMTPPNVIQFPDDRTVYHSFDMTQAIAEHFGDPEADLLFGTDDNPIFLRYWYYHRAQSGLSGHPWMCPHYVEIRLDTGADDPNERASTDYVEAECLQWPRGYNDCNCLLFNTAGVCDTGTCVGGPYDGQTCTEDLDCQIYCAFNEGTCEGSSCVVWTCDDPTGEFLCQGGPNDGQACDPFTPGDCGQSCSEPPFDACTTDSDCRSCVGGPYEGNSCTTDADCSASACAGGVYDGQFCETNEYCQRPCLQSADATCESGIYQGNACTSDNDCWVEPIYPIVNQQWLSGQIAVPSPPLDTQQVWKSLAWGMFAHTSRNPCEDIWPWKPHHYHSNTFDGNRWWDLRSNVKPAVKYGGDFNYARGQAFFEMEIRTNTYIVTMIATQHGDGQDVSFVNAFDAVLERKYLGPFNTVSMGTGPGRKWEYNDTTLEWELVGEPTLWNYPQVYGVGTRWMPTWLDRPAVLGGEVGTTAGACCLPDLSCIETDDVTCAGQDGQFEGYGTVCAETLCCRYPFADADGDGDVDQADFGIWQSCYTGAGGGILPGYCECFDRVDDAGSPAPDGDVDVFDFVEFMNCYTGANVQYDDVINLIYCKP